MLVYRRFYATGDFDEMEICSLWKEIVGASQRGMEGDLALLLTVDDYIKTFATTSA